MEINNNNLNTFYVYGKKLKYFSRKYKKYTKRRTENDEGNPTNVEWAC